MKGVVVEAYGAVDQLVGRDVPDPPSPQGLDVLVRVKACSVNPVSLVANLRLSTVNHR